MPSDRRPLPQLSLTQLTLDLRSNLTVDQVTVNAAAATYDILGDKSMADILDWLEGYCATHPNENFTNAVSDLVAIQFQDRRNLAPGKQGGWNKFTDQKPSPDPSPDQPSP